MILIVDDDPTIVNILKDALHGEGYEVVTAANGAEAYDHVKSGACRCMLLDVNMPRINGVELLLLLQAEGLRVPTVLMADFEDFDDDEMRGFDSVVQYMRKPFTVKDALASVRKHALPVAAT